MSGHDCYQSLGTASRANEPAPVHDVIRGLKQTWPRRALMSGTAPARTRTGEQSPDRCRGQASTADAAGSATPRSGHRRAGRLPTTEPVSRTRVVEPQPDRRADGTDGDSPRESLHSRSARRAWLGPERAVNRSTRMPARWYSPPPRSRNRSCHRRGPLPPHHPYRGAGRRNPACA